MMGIEEPWAPLPEDEQRRQWSTNPFVILWESIKLFYEELYPLLLGETVAFVALVLVLPGPFALAGLWVLAQHARDGRETSWRVMWEGAKRYGWRHWLNVLVGLLGFALLLVNLWFYNNPEISPLKPELSRWLSLAWLVLLYLWAGVFFFLLPFQLEMERPAFGESLKKALFLVLLFPFHWMIWLVVLGGLFILSLRMPPLFVIALPFDALLGMIAVRALIDEVRRRQEAAQAREEEKA
jgi:uncharacterized membrane protein YesL